MEKENLFLKDEIRRKNKVINILLDNFSNRVPEHSNYITSKNTEISTQTDQQNINNIQTSTARSNHRTAITGEKENDKNHIKPNISQLNSKTCDKTHLMKILVIIIKKKNLWIKLIKNLKVKKLLTKAIPTPCIKKDLAQL